MGYVVNLNDMDWYMIEIHLKIDCLVDKYQAQKRNSDQAKAKAGRK